MKQIPCLSCGGSGMQALPRVLAETLALVRGNVTAATIAGKLPFVEVTAQNNRLERLRSLGFVTRQRRGKQWFYSRARQQEAK